MNRTLFASALVAACTTSSAIEEPVGPPASLAPGDPYEGGQVVSVSGDMHCRAVVIEHAPEWECSDAQKAELSAGYGSALPYPLAPVAPSAPAAAALLPKTCDELAGLRRPTLKATQQEELRSARFSALNAKCRPRQEVRYYTEAGSVPYCASGGPGSIGFADAGTWAALPGASAPVQSDDDGAEQYSTTNTQLADVDEADFVKNDAGHVYVLSASGLHVIDAWPAADSHEVAFLPLSETPTRLFLSGDKLVVYGRTGSPGGAPSAAQGCTYGYDCRAQAEPGGTVLRVYDVRAPSAPVLLRRYELSGGFVAARRVGSFVYTVVSESGPPMAPDVSLAVEGDDPEALERDYQRKLARADQAVDALPAAYFLPWAREAREASPPADLPCDDGLAARAARGESFTSLVSLDLETLGAPHRSLVATNPGFVYASADALYLAADGVDGAQTAQYRYGYGVIDTSVHKFSLGGARSTYLGSGSVHGHVLNQFSMDEKDGYLRVATSLGHVPDPNVTSRITVLAESGAGLDTVGVLPGLAPQEDIRSVRFDGDRVFMVTFKKTDPLFTIDLSDPRAPRVLGELKIPGFSTYMHPLDHDHLLAIGFDADDQGSFAYFNGIQLQIFDITDLAAPKLAHKTVIGTRGSASDALTNHLAFNYFAPQKKLALPLTICEGGGNGVYGSNLTFSGLMLFDVDLDTGIVESGRMPFVDAKQAQGSGDCTMWWTDTRSLVKRSIFMDDFVIGLSDTTYKVAASAEADAVLQSIPLTP